MKNIIENIKCKLWIHNKKNIDVSTYIYKWYSIKYTYCTKCWKIVKQSFEVTK